MLYASDLRLWAEPSVWRETLLVDCALPMHVPRRLLSSLLIGALTPPALNAPAAVASDKRTDPRVSMEHALELIRCCTAPAFTQAVRESDTFLYRGESVSRPTILSPAPDLLDAAALDGSVYSDDAALRYFRDLEARLTRERSLARPSTGHIGGSLDEAFLWGEAASIWPLGILSYVVPADRQTFWPCGSPKANRNTCLKPDAATDHFLVDVGLFEALVEGRDVLFETDHNSSYLVIPRKHDKQVCTRRAVARTLVS